MATSSATDLWDVLTGEAASESSLWGETLLPVSAQRQTTWTVPPGGPQGPGSPGSWGGHAVIVAAYNPRRVTCITWGEIKQMTWSFFSAYCEEAYAVLGPEWCKDGKAPSGFDLQGLQNDLNELGGKNPPTGTAG